MIVTQVRIFGFGEVYERLDGATLELREEADLPNATWLIESKDSLQKVEIRDGDDSGVSIDDIRQADEVIPEPWGALLALRNPAAIMAGAKADSITRRREKGGMEFIEFDTESFSTRMQVMNGWVVAKTLYRDGSALAGVYLEFI